MYIYRKHSLIKSIKPSFPFCLLIISYISINNWRQQGFQLATSSKIGMVFSLLTCEKTLGRCIFFFRAGAIKLVELKAAKQTSYYYNNDHDIQYPSGKI